MNDDTSFSDNPMWNMICFCLVQKKPQKNKKNKKKLAYL